MKEYLKLINDAFEQSELKDYLGKGVVDSLIEWFPNGDSLLTKARLASMIDSLYGTEILSNRDFRESLLLSMRRPELIRIRDKCLKGSEKLIEDHAELAKVIAKKPWKKNAVSLMLAEVWGVPEDIFSKESDTSQVCNTITSPDRRFFELLDYQYYIKQRVINNLNAYELERLLIHMPTGTGKTKTTMHIITHYLQFVMKKRGAVIWVAHTNELLEQAYDTFQTVWNHLGDGEIKAYKLWGNKTIDDNEELNGIVFCGLSKLMSIHNSNEGLWNRLKKDCRLIVFDEAHKAAATETRKVIEDLMRIPKGYSNRALIGLSATPGRTTEASYDNNLLTSMFGGKLIYIDTDIINQINMGQLQALNCESERNIIKFFQERGILAKVIPDRLTYRTEFTPNELAILRGELEDLGFDEKDFSQKQLKVLATNKDRNQVILQRLRKLNDEKVPTIVFACSVDHAKMLSAMLTLEEIPNSLVVGSMNSIDRRNAISAFKNKNNNVNIIINYGILTTGFDSTNIQCVFITRPTKSVVLYSQMIGRGLRGPLMGGNPECLLIDIDDNLDLFDNDAAFSHFDDYWNA